MKTLASNPYRLDRCSKIIQSFYAKVASLPHIPSASRYNLTISHERKFMWFRVAKVGTRTVLNHLRLNGANLDVDHGNELHYPIKKYRSYFKFAFVRNPWARLASCWRDKVVRSNMFNFQTSVLNAMQNFDCFVEFVSSLDIENCDRHLKSQSSLIDLNEIDYLGHLETFERDSTHVFEKIGLPADSVVRHNATSNRNDYRELYSESIIKTVSDIYRKDIQIFGYKFDS